MSEDPKNHEPSNVIRGDFLKESRRHRLERENQGLASDTKRIHEESIRANKEESIAREFLKKHGAAVQLEINAMKTVPGASLPILGDILNRYSTLTNLFQECQSREQAAMRYQILHEWIREHFKYDMDHNHEPVVYADTGYNEMFIKWKRHDE